MELIETIMVAMMAGMASTIINIFWVVLQLLLHIIINVSVVDDYVQYSALDRYLAIHGICSIRNFEHAGMPESGYHFLITRKWIFPTGFLAASKKDDKYIIYWFGPGINKVRDHVAGDPNLIIERSVDVMNPWRRDTRVHRIAPPDKENAWQTKVIDLIMLGYTKKSHQSWFICGPPGCGKSTLGVHVAKRLSGLGVTPEVVNNIDFMTPSLSLQDAYHRPTVTSPVIIMLNEFDGAIRHAERKINEKGEHREAICLANTPTLMLNTLDGLEKTSHMIVIATTNMKQSDLVTGIYQRYTRAGRFDNHYQVSANDITADTSKPAASSKRRRGKTSRT